MLAPESVPSPRPERCPRDVPLVLTARHGPGCSENAREEGVAASATTCTYRAQSRAHEAVRPARARAGGAVSGHITCSVRVR